MEETCGLAVWFWKDVRQAEFVLHLVLVYHVQKFSDQPLTSYPDAQGSLPPVAENTQIVSHYLILTDKVHPC